MSQKSRPNGVSRMLRRTVRPVRPALPIASTTSGGGICYECRPLDEAGHVAVVKG